MRSIVRAVVCLAFLTVLGVALAGPATAGPPSLSVTAVFDKPSYVSGEAISVKFSVHNSGTTAATGITAQDDFSSTELAVGGFGALSNGTTIPAGGTVTVTLTGHPGSLTATKVTLAGEIFDQQGNGVAPFSFSAPVILRTAKVSGLVFADANSNGKADSGEALNGAKVRLGYLYGNKSYSVTTSGGGRFSATLPTATYYVSGSGNGWAVIPRIVDIGSSGANLALRAVKPLGQGVLTAKIHFTKHTYAPGATVHVVVTLTNTGSTTLRGITASCNRVGDDDELNNNDGRWGDLAADGPGVTLVAHQSRTFTIIDKVPAGAEQTGRVVVGCDFGYPGVDQGHRPDAFDTAKVPGLNGTIVGEVQYFPHGSGGAAVGLANVRVVLVDPTTCPALTRTATTNANGQFRIASAPAGASYKLYIYPPSGWKVSFQNPTNAMIIGNDTNRFGVVVEHGSATVPAVPTGCATSTPPSASPTTAPLSNTGTSSAGLVALGSGAVLAGLLVMLSARRRRAH